METKENLVIGANGFLGKELMKSFSSSEVDGVYNVNKNNLIEGYNYFPSSEIDNLSNDYKTIYLVAAFIPGASGMENLDKLDQANVKLAEKVVNKFINSKIVYASSVSVYGNVAGEISELTTPAPISDYGRSKLYAEQVIMKTKAYAIVRISSIYGSEMNETTFIPLMVNQALTINKITLFGSGERQQNYIHVSDVVSFLRGAAKLKISTCLLAADEISCSNIKIANLVKDELEGVEIVYIGDDNSPSFNYNSRYSWGLIHINQMRSLKAGVKEYIQWKRRQS